MSAVALQVPVETGKGLLDALRIAERDYGLHYLWIHEADKPVGVVVRADEFRRLRAAAGEPLGVTPTAGA